MPQSPPTFRPAHLPNRLVLRRNYDRKRADDPVRKLKKTARWQALRAHQLRAEPLCRMCLADGRPVAATICDHIEPHGGDLYKFWHGPFQSLCKPHHDREKQREERGIQS
jgi:5-methylcytosine-specific restriction enzyme A